MYVEIVGFDFATGAVGSDCGCWIAFLGVGVGTGRLAKLRRIIGDLDLLLLVDLFVAAFGRGCVGDLDVLEPLYME